LLFTDASNARYLAALEPLLISVQFTLVGFGVIKDQAAVDAMSRTGNPQEILRGPLFYGIVFVVVTLFYWKDTPIGIVALMLMCGGDGLADVVGRRWGTRKLPWAKEKSWLGSMGMFVGGWTFSLFIVYCFVLAGQFPGPTREYLMPLTIIALAGTLVESIPIRDIDNITVTAAAIVLGHWLL
jgi:phytol kinase